MTTIDSPIPKSTTTATRTNDHTKLAPNALGLPQVLFCIVTGAAPLAAMMFNVPVVVSGGGSAAPVAFAIATVVLTIFSVGYIEMSRRVSAVGGFYTFITRGLGKELGMGAAILIALCYLIFSAAVIGVLGYFAATSFEAWFSIDMPGYVYSFAALAIISAFAFFHIELTAKVLGVALIAEVIALLVLAGGVIVAGGDSGLSAEPLKPGALFDNDSAIATFGAAAVGVALFGAFWSWVGFEMAPNYAEESKEPKRIAKAATYGSVVGLGIFYVFISWIFVVGWGTDNAAPGVLGQFEGEYGSAFYPLTDRYVGGGLTTILEVLIITSSFACAMAFYNTAARYLYALARERALPAPLARTHPKRHSPYVASMAVSAIVALYILGFTIYDSSTEASLLKLGTWSPLLGVLGILGVQAICCVAIVRFFMTSAKDGFHWWKTALAPAIGFVAQLGACYLLIDNRDALSGAGDVAYIKYLPYVPLVFFAAGICLALWMRYEARDRYELVGSFEHEEPDVVEHRIAGGPTPAVGA